MRVLIALCVIGILTIPAGIFAMDVSEIGLITGHLRIGTSGGDKFGYTIGHELEEEHKERMKNLDNNIGIGGSLSYRKGISSSILFGFSFDYFRSGDMKGLGVDDVAREDSTFEGGSYSLIGVSLNLQPGMSITEELMIFAEFGLGGYSARLEGKSQDLNAAMNVGLAVDYFVSDAMAIELSVRKPLFLSEFVFVDEYYTLDPSPLKIGLGVSLIRE